MWPHGHIRWPHGGRVCGGDPRAARAAHVTRAVVALLAGHVRERRDIEDWQFDEAALGLEAPEVLKAVRERLKADFVFEPFDGEAVVGHFVEVVEGEHEGKRGVISLDYSGHYKVTFADGTE